ncbi:MAG TPA: hypothetical protein PKD77_03055 [Rudaea sp.]|jgi:uncharacterized repeat protein (TIGR01451 family)|nr:hypothetical protein [Rudaea sp.]
MIGSAVAATSPIGLTIDLLAPNTACNGSQCPTDINIPILSALPLGSSLFSYATGPGSPTNYLSTVTLDNTNAASYPVICDEVSGSTPGPAGAVGFTTPFSNSSFSGGQLGFGSGGPLSAVVDLSSMTYTGQSAGQAQVALTVNNTATKQVMCYPILAIGAVASGAASPVFAANGTVAGDRIFVGNFEDPLATVPAGEPWISALTVGSLSASTNQAIYVLQIHNASAAASSGWFVNFGYDTAYFGSTGGQWCVISPTIAQPGNMPGSCIQNNMTTSPRYTVKSSDVHNTSINGGSADNTDSVYLKVTLTAPVPPSPPITNWPTLPASFYPALGAIFPPAGVYPQRLDNKAAVASASNVPVQNIGSISCTNQATPVCNVSNPDGVSAPVSFANTVSNTGAATIDPLVYFVDPNANSTSPGNVSGAPSPDALTLSNLSCSDPQNILASPANSVTISQSTSASGAQKLSFNFVPDTGVPYRSGTATCTATFANNGYSPALAKNVAFSIEMQKAAVAGVTMTTSTAGPVGQNDTIAYTVTVVNAGNASLSGIPVSDVPGSGLASVVWNSCTPIGAGACPLSLASGNSQTIPSLSGNGDGVTFALTGTVGSVVTPTPLQMVSNSASISVSGGSCSGGQCMTPTVTVPTVPIIGVSNTPLSQSNSAGVNPYSVKVNNGGGTAVSGLSLGALITPNGSATVAYSGCTAGTNNSSTAGDGSNMAIAGGDNVTCTATLTINTPPTSNPITITSAVPIGSASPNSAICDSSACQAAETINP